MKFIWWFRGMPETGLLGFYTKQDRDDFDSGKQGPFRRVTSDGRNKTILANENFHQLVYRLEAETGKEQP